MYVPIPYIRAAPPPRQASLNNVRIHIARAFYITMRSMTTRGIPVHVPHDASTGGGGGA